MKDDGIKSLAGQKTLKVLPDIKIILELISKGVSLHDTLNTLVEYIETNSNEMICSILLLDDEKQLRHGAAPNLPQDYIRNIDGTPIGPNQGSCGTAAFNNQQIVVADIANDPLWVDYKELALLYDLRACWSTPIRSSTGNVLGTFAIYYNQPCKPSEYHLQLIEQAIYLAAIAIEHARVEEDLLKSEEELRASFHLIESIRNLLENYIVDSDSSQVFEDLLLTILNTSDSEYGFITEVQWMKSGAPCFQIRASKRRFAKAGVHGYQNGPFSEILESGDLESFFDQIVNSGEAVTIGGPIEQPQLCSMVKSLFGKELRTCIGLPINSQGNLAAVVVIANRLAGYSKEFIEFIKPLLITGGTLLKAHRNEMTRVINERALKVSEERFSKVFHLNPLGKVIINFKTEQLIDVNESFLITTQYAREEIMGQTIHELNLFADQVHWQDIVGIARKEGMVYDQETLLQTKSGEIRYIQCYACLIQATGDPLLLVMFKDFTEQKHAKEINRQLQIQLQHGQKMKAMGQLAAEVAHEFNNILVGINMNSELLLLTAENELPEEYRSPLVEIKNSGERATELIKQMLTFGRKKEPNTSWIALNRLVESHQKMYQRILGEGIKFQLDLDLNTRPAWADEAEIEQALINLVVNARDAMPAGGTLAIRTQNVLFTEDQLVREYVTLPGSYSQISVIDNGCGMSAETVEQIFEPFFTTKPAEMGTGLGLSTVFRDISNNGGFISVESQLGEGTEFRIYLPQEQGKTVETHTDALAASHNSIIGGTETLLVCDDEESVLTVVSALLEKIGYTVIKALGPHQAIQALQSHIGKISLLLTDFNMPEMNGQQLAKQLMELDPDLKVILLSGMTGDILDNVDDFELIQKPAQIGLLAQKIRKVLGDEQ
ncbi:GAF domain-containing protein [Gimesia sp.]|uniref:GAF domain-containing protein n=1 Tax=Gimesia sp. TaxID=2024833 RepID=UPI003A91B56E